MIIRTQPESFSELGSRPARTGTDTGTGVLLVLSLTDCCTIYSNRNFVLYDRIRLQLATIISHLFVIPFRTYFSISLHNDSLSCWYNVLCFMSVDGALSKH